MEVQANLQMTPYGYANETVTQTSREYVDVEEIQECKGEYYARVSRFDEGVKTKKNVHERYVL